MPFSRTTALFQACVFFDANRFDEVVDLNSTTEKKDLSSYTEKDPI